jgi:hypothetical protein
MAATQPKQIMITKIGSAVSEPQGSTPAIPFRAEVQTDDGPMVLNLTQNAAAELKVELEKYLQARGYP